jgi:flavin-binding protein dodecin
MGTKSVAKVIEVVGSSDKSWTDAADRAVRVAAKTVNNITGAQVMHMTAQVKGGKIETYKTTVKVAFGVED